MDQLKDGKDYEIIENNIGNILCCHVESEFDNKQIDANLVKLFKLAQISIDYLLEMRRHTIVELELCREKLTATATVNLATMTVSLM